MFDRFSLPDVAAVARRTMVGALVAGVVGLAAALALNQPWVALGLCIGLGLGMTNFRLIVRSVLKVGRRAGANTRRPLAMNTVSRLMLLTVVALAILWIVPPLGFGLIAGMALFQLLLLFNVTRSMLKAGGGGGGGGSAGLVMGLLSGAATGGLLGDEGAEDETAAGQPALPGLDDAGHNGRGAARA